MHLASPHFRLSMGQMPRSGIPGSANVLRGCLFWWWRQVPFRLDGKQPTAALSALVPSLTLRHGPSSHSIPTAGLPWQLVPAAEEEWRLYCDRIGRWLRPRLSSGQVWV